MIGIGTEETRLDDFQKRFFSRLDKKKLASADQPGEDEDPLPDPIAPIHSAKQPNRNDPCPCGSGKKYKKCCGTQK